ncbi:MAG: hypothetical protein ABSG50_01555 [Opitutaceae bacterium]
MKTDAPEELRPAATENRSCYLQADFFGAASRERSLLQKTPDGFIGLKEPVELLKGGSIELSGILDSLDDPIDQGVVFPALIQTLIEPFGRCLDLGELHLDFCDGGVWRIHDVPFGAMLLLPP